MHFETSRPDFSEKYLVQHFRYSCERSHFTTHKDFKSSIQKWGRLNWWLLFKESGLSCLPKTTACKQVPSRVVPRHGTALTCRHHLLIMQSMPVFIHLQMHQQPASVLPPLYQPGSFPARSRPVQSVKLRFPSKAQTRHRRPQHTNTAKLDFWFCDYLMRCFCVSKSWLSLNKHCLIHINASQSSSTIYRHSGTPQPLLHSTAQVWTIPRVLHFPPSFSNFSYT